MTGHTNQVSPVMGHEVLQVLADLGGDAPVEQLKEEVFQRFGSGAVFANCAGNLFNFEQLLVFLESRKKLEVAGQHIRLGIIPACNHS